MHSSGTMEITFYSVQTFFHSLNEKILSHNVRWQFKYDFPGALPLRSTFNVFYVYANESQNKNFDGISSQLNRVRFD